MMKKEMVIGILAAGLLILTAPLAMALDDNTAQGVTSEIKGDINKVDNAAKEDIAIVNGDIKNAAEDVHEKVQDRVDAAKEDIAIVNGDIKNAAEDVHEKVQDRVKK
ncbi:MAG: hypothetical protein U9P80_05525 [Thermodesulfobacteriota bacterium]|nr:hypothetical protein [Thermodesulfobacteriota bacterium]